MLQLKEIRLYDGSLCEDDCLSWWYTENEDKVLAWVMDFTQHFPYWDEIKMPEGYNSIIKIGEVWYWTFIHYN